MRVRHALLAALAAVPLVVAGAGTASAGTGASQECGDHLYGYQEVPVDNGIVTVGAELWYPPTEPTNAVILCFSNTPYGYPSTATGGALWIFFGNWGTPTSPDIRVNTYCDDDLGTQTFQWSSVGYCNFHNGISVSLSTTTVVGSLPACFIKVGSVCSPVTPPVGAPVPTITVTVANNAVTV